jgi:hypothetical protein
MKKLLIICSVLLALPIIGCTSVTPEELAEFKTKSALVKEMSIRCETDTALCCPALKEAARAMETVIVAVED